MDLTLGMWKMVPNVGFSLCVFCPLFAKNVRLFPENVRYFLGNVRLFTEDVPLFAEKSGLTSTKGGGVGNEEGRDSKRRLDFAEKK